MHKYQRNFLAQFLVIFGAFLSFYAEFSGGSNYSSQNAGTITNKFQLHVYYFQFG